MSWTSEMMANEEEERIAKLAIWNLTIAAAADAVYIKGDSAGCSIAESCTRETCRSEIEALRK